jgi:DNA polymerase III subunit alpha
MTEFVHLKCHSEFSIVDGVPGVKAYVSAAKSAGMNAMALTDFTNLFGMVKFYKNATANGVKPIIGADFNMSLDGDEADDSTARVSVLCQNQIGYAHITELISRAYTQGQQTGAPVITMAWLEELNEGLIVLSAAAQGDVGMALLADNKAEVKTRIERWMSIFPDRYYLELQRTGRRDDERCVAASVLLAQEYDLPVVATNDVCFLKTDDFEAHEARVCIHDSYVLDDHRRPKRYSTQQYFRTPDEMAELFSDIPEALINSVEIAKRCTVTLELGRVCLPQFPVPEGLTVDSYLRQLSEEGLAQHLGDKVTQEYHDRLKIELDVIVNMGFPGYFLIVADFIQWAKNNDIPVGPGRGSGAGSLVAYCLSITELDPIEHELLFERFLNPERVSMPDFDVDFCMDRRDEVIDYVAQKYGRESVSQIITYGTMAAKAVVRDVGRVLSMPYGMVDKIAKLIPFEIGMTLDKALADEEQLRRRYHEEDEVRTLIDLAKKLEGVTRNAGKHAGGVVIAPGKLTDFSPLYCEPGNPHIVTQFDKDDVETVGLVKFDFLGLRTLTIIDWAVRAANAKRKKSGEAPIDISKIELDDPKSFVLLKACETSAVFQLESRGMKDLIKRLQPDCFDEITALVALFRPGPLQSGMVDDFIDRKHGVSKVVYPHPALETILKPTYGVILYQEQVMQIAQVLAGYSLGGADILRRAMGKKKPEEMAKQRVIFTDGAKAGGVDEKVATGIFDLMEKFAGYGFNKSHSAAYALIAYQTAWLKAHYPAEFMAAVLSSDMDNTEKVVNFYTECQRMRQKIDFPDINIGHYPFVVNEEGVIEYGLGAVKGVGQAVIELLVEERDNNGHYKDLFDLCVRMDTRKLNRRALEAFINAGAMDGFGQDRAVLIASVDKALKNADQHKKNAAQGQDDLFAMMPETADAIKMDYVIAAHWSDKKKLQGEKDALGLYLSGHPLQVYAAELAAFTSATIKECKPVEGRKQVIAGMIVAMRVITTKSGNRMAVLGIEDQTGRMDVTVFPKLYEKERELLIKDTIVVIKGEVAHDDFTGGIKVVADEITNLTMVRNRMAKRVMIPVHAQKDVDQLLARLPHIIQPYVGGTCPIVIVYHTDKAQAQLKLGQDWCVEPSDELIEKLNVLSHDVVSVEY